MTRLLTKSDIEKKENKKLLQFFSDDNLFKLTEALKVRAKAFLEFGQLGHLSMMSVAVVVMVEYERMVVFNLYDRGRVIVLAAHKQRMLRIVVIMIIVGGHR